MKLTGRCDWCGKSISFYPSKANQRHHFCSRVCQSAFCNKRTNPDGYRDYADWSNNGKRFTEMNRRLNPTRMTAQTREKLRNARINIGAGKSYAKLYGTHEHRVVAEQMLGRPLRKKEIVHHRDGNKRNNSPENIVVFASQSEHARYHMELKLFIQEIRKMDGGDAK